MTAYHTTFHVEIDATCVEQARSIASMIAEILLAEGCDPVAGGEIREGAIVYDDGSNALLVERDGERYVFDAGELS